ncbi:MAG: tyrosine-type recombinase/integrase [Candidatus Eisenbacteria bacterium]|nr:tyrosine-type recombinase/integrase [Candidatus Eisenbacteria bacterium]
MTSFGLATGFLKEVIIMLSRYFHAADRIQNIRSSPGGAFFEGFAEALLQRGYAEITARRHIRAAEHIVRWASRRGLSVCDLDDEALRRFGRHLPRCHCGHYACARRLEVIGGARLFLRYLLGISEPAIMEPPPASPDPPLLHEFREWMRAQRGTHDRTLYNYSIPIRALLWDVGGEPSKLDARRLRQFVLKQSHTTVWTARRCTTALRMFLRFLVAEGRCRAGLLNAVPVVPHWPLAALPRYLPPEDVERIVDSCDVSSSIGKRDRAILLLLARLGLRASDIVQMRLQDIDWKGAWIRVAGKGRRQARLPLSREVGQAIVTYLQEGRPLASASTDALFLRSRAPFRGFRTHSTVSVIVAGAIRRAQVKPPSRGAAHLLRHSIATTMLRRGASLQEISALLRHRSIETTQVYAKVDIAGLQHIAQPWPEVRSC